VVFFALLRCGAAPVLALPAHRHVEIEHFVGLAGAVAYVIPDRHERFDYRELAGRVVSGAPSLRHVLVAGDPGPPGGAVSTGSELGRAQARPAPAAARRGRPGQPTRRPPGRCAARWPGEASPAGRHTPRVVGSASRAQRPMTRSARPVPAAGALRRRALSGYVYRVLEVVRTELVTPALRRIVLGGPDLAGFGTSRAGPNIKIYFPRQGQRRPLMPEPDGQGGLWWPPDDLRPIMRTYSVRRFEPDLGVAGGWWAGSCCYPTAHPACSIKAWPAWCAVRTQPAGGGPAGRRWASGRRRQRGGGGRGGPEAV
jgi:hypothetical protein